jgi:perosamine synthetase
MRGYAGFCLNRMKDAAKLLLGRPLATPPLVATTLGKDDAAIALRHLEEGPGADDPRMEEEYGRAFAAWNGSRFAFPFMAGRAALGACIHALGLRPGDEAVLPGYTCVVVYNAFRAAGVEVRWCDIELETFGPDSASLKRAVTPRTRAVLIHHLYGLVCRDYLEILDFARERGLYIIEDCAQGTGAALDGVKVGNRGDVAFFSSEISKVFTTVMGGMAVTNDDGLAERLADYHGGLGRPDNRIVRRLLENVVFYYNSYSDPARWWKKDWVSLRHPGWRFVPVSEEEMLGGGFELHGCRMPPSLAEVGLNQLGKLEERNRRRREAAERWDDWCGARGLARPLVLPGSEPVFLRYPVLVEPEMKSNTDWAYRELGVRPGVWFTSNLHPSELEVHGCPRADEAVRRCINLPT